MAECFVFSGCILDTGRRTLTCGGREVAIGDRAYGVLLTLVRSPGKVVTKRELLDAVWSDVTVVEDNLVKAVGELRTALGDQASNPQFIRTVHRRGYVFVAPLEVAPESAADDEAGPASASGIRTRRPWLAVSAIVAAAALAGLAAVWSGRGESAARREPSFDRWQVRELSAVPISLIKPAFAPSGELLAAVAVDHESGVHSLCLVTPSGGDPLRLTHDIEVRGPSPEFSADGSRILFTTYAVDLEHGLRPEIWEVPVLGGRPRRVLEWASAADESPDGHSMVYAAVDTSGTRIRVREPSGRELDVAATGYWPRWSPDGRWIAYTTSDPEGGDGEVWMVRPDGGDPHRPCEGEGQVYGLSWMPDSRGVVYSMDRGDTANLWYASVAGGVCTPAARGPGDFSAPAVSPDGRRIVFTFSFPSGTVLWAPRPDQPLTTLLADEGLLQMALAPDRHRLATIVGARGHQPALEVFDLGSRERRVVSGLEAADVSWSADGQALLVSAGAPDRSAQWIWRVPVDGGLPTPVLRGRDSWSWPAASPDGRRIAAVRGDASGETLVVTELESGRSAELAVAPVIADLHWSPDGRWLAWSGSERPPEADAGGIWLMPSVGGPVQRLVPDGQFPTWIGADELLFVRTLANRGVWRLRMSDESIELTPSGVLPRVQGVWGLDAGPHGEPVVVLTKSHTPLLYELEAPRD
jgi:DNA-binding winged helix-turn-helix (wHTH) protein/Tol biopolymer transport system component